MSSEQTRKPFLRTLRRVVGLARPYRWAFNGAWALSLVLAPLASLRPLLMGYAVDEFVLKGNLQGLVRVIALLIGVLVLEASLQFLFSYLTSWLGQSIIRDLRVRVFDRINSLRLAYFDRTPVGRSITRTISDIESVNAVFSQGVITISADMLSMAVVLATMVYISPLLTGICLAFLPLLLLAAYYFKEGVRKSYEKVRVQVSNMNAFLQERISGMRIVQLFGAEKDEHDRFQEINGRLLKANEDGIFHYALFFPIVEIVSAATLGLMVWYGTRGVLDDSVTLGALVAFPQLIDRLYRPIRLIADKFNTLQMGLVASERVFEILDNEERIPDKGTLAPDALRGEVVFDGVWFSYAGEKPEENWVLRDVNFRVPAGETLAIIGPTGSGKTTIINLLGRFYDIQRGQILVDGHPAEEYRLEALRRRIAVVLQDVFLFSGTVLENITLRNPGISRERVVEAARTIGAHEFIERLPGGYDYEVKERGAALSMGQRQLISFVRALVFDPDILILDEATSSIDPESESVIRHAIETLIQKRTSIVIAHRLSTVQNAHQVLVLSKGEVLECGPPKELLQRAEGHYRQLYELQG